MLKKILLATVAVMAIATSAVAADVKEFRIGLLGGENEADRLANFQCLVEKLPAAIGVEKVSLFPAADYDGVVQGLLGGRQVTFAHRRIEDRPPVRAVAPRGPFASTATPPPLP